MRRQTWLLLLFFATVFITAGCTTAIGEPGIPGPDGPAGAPGPAGLPGAPGAAGPAGQDGRNYEYLAFVGSETCAECHQDIYDVVALSGHTGQFSATTADQPAEVAALPAGYPWSEPGVQCEACHGPGNLHADHPLTWEMRLDREAQACEDCHVSGSPDSDGALNPHYQYEELFQGKHSTIDCVNCHDPHAGVAQLQQSEAPTTRTTCENCHFAEANNHANEPHARFNLECSDCHMPWVAQSALGAPATSTGEVRAHLMAIDPAQIGQFDDASGEIQPQLGLDYACRSCHNPDGAGRVKTDEALVETATGYHTPPAATPVAPE